MDASEESHGGHVRQVEAAGEFGKPPQRWFAELERQFIGGIMHGTSSFDDAPALNMSTWSMREAPATIA